MWRSENEWAAGIYIEFLSLLYAGVPGECSKSRPVTSKTAFAKLSASSAIALPQKRGESFPLGASRAEKPEWSDKVTSEF